MKCNVKKGGGLFFSSLFPLVWGAIVIVCILAGCAESRINSDGMQPGVEGESIHIFTVASGNQSKLGALVRAIDSYLLENDYEVASSENGEMKVYRYNGPGSIVTLEWTRHGVGVRYKYKSDKRDADARERKMLRPDALREWISMQYSGAR